eukprot:6372621-Prymnesium_polylepis.1
MARRTRRTKARPTAPLTTRAGGRPRGKRIASETAQSSQRVGAADTSAHSSRPGSPSSLVPASRPPHPTSRRGCCSDDEMRWRSD